MERFNLKKLKEVDGKEQNRVEISNRYATLEILDAMEDINRAWETIRGNIKISVKECLRYYETSHTAVVAGSKHNKWG
jgi:hypothetical protein